MATTPTSIGPIGARQINRNLYVGQSDLTTIQAAVNMGVQLNSVFVVVIPFDYIGTDQISAVTGGTNNISIQDHRYGQLQTYYWNSTDLAFEPLRFQQMHGFVATGTPTSIPAGSATFSYDTANRSLNLAVNNGTVLHNFIECTWGVLSSAPVTYLESDLLVDGVIACTPDSAPGAIAGIPHGMIVTWNLSNGGNETDFINSKPSGAGGFYWYNVIQGSTIDDTTPQMMTLDNNGSLYVASDLTVNGPITGEAMTLTGLLTGTGITLTGNLAASDAKFATCEVANSPVRTFANTGDAPAGMVWPPIGIAVSAGSTWGTSISPASLATWPAAGIPVSTGSAWGTPIAPANVPLLNQSNQSTGDFTAKSLHSSGATSASVLPNSIWLDYSGGNGRLISTGPSAGTLAGIQLFGVDGAGAGLTQFAAFGTVATISAPLTISGNFTANGFATINASSGTVAGKTTIRNYAGTGTAINPADAAGGLYLCMDSGTAGTHFANGSTGLLVGGVDSSGNASFNGTVISGGQMGMMNRAAAVGYAGANVNSDNTSLILNPGTGANKVYFNWDHGTGGVVFGNGAATQVAAITGAGGATFATLSVSGLKTFHIRHPLNDSKDLVHACLEGPENGVFYRGEGITDGGWIEITLPDYFEALTMKENRSVLLTALFEDDAEQIGMLAAGRVKDGKFKVWSALPAQKFYWEVKAVRGDIDPLEVEPPHVEPEGMPKPEHKGANANEEG